MDSFEWMVGCILALIFGVPLWFLYTLNAEKIYNFWFKKQKLAKKVAITIKKDRSSDCARATFYINNNYDRKISQAEWLKYCQEIIRQPLDPNSQEYAEAVAPIINAIVVGDYGYYVRRGAENMVGTLTQFEPGENDRISLNYFIEPYEYHENAALAAKSSEEKASRTQHYTEYTTDYAAEAKAKQKALEERYAQIKADRAAGKRCANCVHSSSCSMSVKRQTGSCGGYTPRHK